MSDPLSAPAPKQPRPRPRTRQGGPRPPQSRESKFIGYLVLGFGIVAVVAVLLLAFMGGGAPDTNVRQPAPGQAAKIAPLKPQELIQAPEPVPEPEYKSPFKRQPNMDAAGLDGNWQGMIGQFTAVLQMNKGVYQIILATDDSYMPRYYSSGTYKVLEDMITFTPQNNWPPPVTRSGKGNYQAITRAPFSLMSAFYEGKMLWANVPPTEERVRRYLEVPVFMSEDVAYVVWQRIE